MKMNKTAKFLLPILNYNEVAKLMLAKVDKLAVYLSNDDRYTMKMLVSLDVGFEDLNDLIETLEFYGYTIKKELREDFILLSITFPNRWFKIIDKFIQGKYTEMYSKTLKNKLFPTANMKNILAILNKDKMAVEEMQKEMFKVFNTNVSVEELENFKQYSLPPTVKDEIFEPKTDKYKFLKIYYENEQKMESIQG